MYIIYIQPGLGFISNIHVYTFFDHDSGERKSAMAKRLLSVLFVFKGYIGKELCEGISKLDWPFSESFPFSFLE